jgi:aerobic-type carbon monoxide dehydrogenase small subunit (CoxS/CutS family)
MDDMDVVILEVSQLLRGTSGDGSSSSSSRHMHWEGGRVQHRAVNACLCPLYTVEGMHLVTVEGEFASLARVAWRW